MIIAFATAFVTYVIASTLDALGSARASHLAGTTEGNWVIRKLFGSQPSAAKLIAFNLAWFQLEIAAAFIYFQLDANTGGIAFLDTLLLFLIGLRFREAYIAHRYILNATSATHEPMPALGSWYRKLFWGRSQWFGGE